MHGIGNEEEKEVNRKQALQKEFEDLKIQLHSIENYRGRVPGMPIEATEARRTELASRIQAISAELRRLES